MPPSSPSSSRLLRVGIVGAGLMGRWHAASARHAGATVAAVVDPRPEAGGLLAEEHDAASYRDLDRALAAEALDVLHVCTPLETHHELTARALALGLHVFVEKPLTPNAEATNDLLATAREAGCLVCPVHQFPFQRGVQTALGWRTRLGALRGFDAVFHSAGADGDATPPADAVVADILPHPLSLMQTLLPRGGVADDWHTRHPRAGELTATAEQDDISIRLRISMSARPTVASLKLYGTRGTAHLDLFHGYAFFEPGAVSRVQKITAPFQRAGRTLSAATSNLGGRIVRREPAYPGLRELTDRFYRAIRGEAPPPYSDEQIAEAALLRDRLIRQACLLEHTPSP